LGGGEKKGAEKFERIQLREDCGAKSKKSRNRYVLGAAWEIFNLELSIMSKKFPRI
jgi:hypothetical protein